LETNAFVKELGEPEDYVHKYFDESTKCIGYVDG